MLLGDTGFGPQKLAVLAAYSLRQNLLVWLKTYKADVELRQNIDPSVGYRASSISGRSNIDRAAAAAVAETQATGDFMSPRGSQFPPMDIMLETDNEGVMDSSASLRQSAVATPSQRDAFLNGGSDAGSMGGSHNGRGTDPLVHFASPSSRSLQGPSFSSNAFPSFQGHSSLDDANSSQPMPSTSAGTSSEYGSIPHSDSNPGLSSPTSPTGLPKPSRALPPPPATAPVPPSPFAMVSPFAQASQSDSVAGFPPLDRVNSATGSIQSASSERERRPTVRFADPPTLDTPAPATQPDRTYNHTNSGFTELVMARGGSSLAPPAHPQADPQAGPQADPQARGHARSRSDLQSSQRSLRRNKSMSRQERAASVTLDALELPPLPLPAEAVGTSPQDAASPVGSPVVSPAVSRQPSRQMSLSMRTLSGFRYRATSDNAAFRRSAQMETAVFGIAKLHYGFLLGNFPLNSAE